MDIKKNNPIDVDPDPSPNRGATTLRHYWTRGKGAAKIRWGVSGDFNRCVMHLRKYVSDPKGLCNVYHTAAVGAPPGHGHVGGKDFTQENLEYKRSFSSERLAELGKQGKAFRNHNGEWSYPIENASDLANAIRAFGRSASADRESLKAYIKRRAKALGKADLIPDNWSSKELNGFDLELQETLLYANMLKSLSVAEMLDILDINDQETKENQMEFEHKNLGVTGGITETAEEGVIEALVSVTGIKDNVNDIIVPGAYEKTLQTRKPKGVWSHDWNNPVSKVEDIKELLPGDPKLPAKLANGDPWPKEAGALYVKVRFNLETQAGRDAYSNVKFYADDTEWSIGYNVPKGAASIDQKSGVRSIKTLELFEFSPVLFGAASNARTLISSVKSLFENDDEFLAEVKSVIEKKEEPEVPVTGVAEPVPTGVELAEPGVAFAPEVETSEEATGEIIGQTPVVSAQEVVAEVVTQGGKPNVEVAGSAAVASSVQEVDDINRAIGEAKGFIPTADEPDRVQQISVAIENIESIKETVATAPPQ